MTPFDTPMAGDRYRIEVRRGSAIKRLWSKKGGGAVSIVDTNGVAVWTRSLDSPSETLRLADLIQEQVLTASLASFEEWLRTEGANQG